MAYGNQGNSKPAYGSARTAAAPAAARIDGNAARKFEDDPNEVGIGYTKEMKTGGEYISVKLTRDLNLKAGDKLVVFNNDKVKNRTDKTPTHKLKLAVSKK